MEGSISFTLASLSLPGIVLHHLRRSLNRRSLPFAPVSVQTKPRSLISGRAPHRTFATVDRAEEAATFDSRLIPSNGIKMELSGPEQIKRKRGQHRETLAPVETSSISSELPEKSKRGRPQKHLCVTSGPATRLTSPTSEKRTGDSGASPSPAPHFHSSSSEKPKQGRSAKAMDLNALGFPPGSPSKRGRGRPPKHTTTTSDRLSHKAAGVMGASGKADANCSDGSPEDADGRDRDAAVHRLRNRDGSSRLGYSGKELDHADEGKSVKNKQGTLDRPSADRNSSPHSRRHHKAAHQTSSLLAMPAPAVHTDVIMEEVVRHSPFMDAVVKVFCVHTEPNFSLPWQMKRQFSSNSSGFIISGRRILTNAHSVEHHTQVKVKRRGSDTKFLARVLAIGTECDIALLTVNSDEFWEGAPPVDFGTLPSLQDAVTVVGYPIGGDTISVTSGVVSRIEVTSYVHGATELLGVQIDAAINAGNSGGPAFNAKGQCVGIAFQSLKHEDAENIGYIIPTPVITHFINDFERNGDYTGFPILGIDWQKIENPDLRRSLGMAPQQKGVRVRRVESTAPAAKFLKSSDILLSFDGINVANDGTVPFRHGERIGFSYLVSQKYTGEKATIRILRNKKFLEFDVKLDTHKRLVPVHTKGRPPSYYILAGIVFTAVSVPYLRSEYGKDYDYDAPVKLLDKLLYSMAKTEDEQLIVISQVLVADINIGYEDIVNTQVLALNGTPVQNLKHLAHMVETCEEEFLRLDLEYQQMIVLETKKAEAATEEILVTHCIPSAVSEDLKA